MPTFCKQKLAFSVRICKIEKVILRLTSSDEEKKKKKQMLEAEYIPPSTVYGLKIICRVPRTINNNNTVSSMEVNSQRSCSSRNQSTFYPLILRVVKFLYQLLPFRALCSSIKPVSQIKEEQSQPQALRTHGKSLHRKWQSLIALA